jgi:nucleotide-binding universal stress UspA family protein
MNWRPIVAGVDQSDEGIRSAQAAVELARAAQTECYLVHAVGDPARALFYPEIPMGMGDLRESVLAAAKALVKASLRNKVPAPVLDQLDCRLGPPGIVLGEVANERNAEMIVLGGKHHLALGRWLAGSTAHHMVRTHDRPLLVVGPSRHGVAKFERVLLGVDLSHAAKPAIYAAERLAGLFNSRLRALHVVEPVPWIELAPLTQEELQLRSEEELNRSVWPRVLYPGAERLVRRGFAADTLAAAAAEWNADLLVVGSHGRGWVERILIGSVTERLLNLLPTSLLIVPAPGAAAKEAARVTEMMAGVQT